MRRLHIAGQNLKDAVPATAKGIQPLRSLHIAGKNFEEAVPATAEGI